MKQIIAALCFCMIAIVTNAQNTSPLQQVLTDYFTIKNDLVKDDANAASSAAGKLLSDTKSIDVKALSNNEQTAFDSAKDKIIYNANHISEVNDIDHQREHFGELSAAIMQLAQSASLSQQAIYIDYCPMKEASWLSAEKEIKNPYYGDAMLTCGSVKETVKP